MPFAAALSTQADTAKALGEVLSRTREQLQGPVDLGLVFFSPHHAARAKTISHEITRQLTLRCLLGCPGESIVGNEREVENGPALSLWLGRWSDQVSISPFHLTVEDTSEGYSLLGWPDDFFSVDPAQAVVLTLADPFTFPVDDYLRKINEEVRGLRVMGGMASGARQPGENVLLLDDRMVDQGAVSVLLQGPVQVRSVVSQGCRPIGRPLVVTKAKDNLVLEVGGQTPLAYLQELWPRLEPRDQELVQQGLHVGRVTSEYRAVFDRGDFLIRNVLGLDRNTGALAITERVRVGQTIQFHVRDAATADEDLHALLRIDRDRARQAAAGALLFTCNGRGTRLFQQPSHDAGVVAQEMGALPLAGFFAQGELGPVGGENFIHGFTASVVLFE